MKKLLFLLLLLFPITVFAKTPNREETFKVIKNIRNVTVMDGVKIDSTEVDDDYIIFTVNGEEAKVKYAFVNNKFSFTSGYLFLDKNNKIIGEPFDNEYAFYLYSIFENKSYIPYDADSYYNSSTIKKIVNNSFAMDYKEKTNTFGFSLEQVAGNKYRIVYNYYLDGDYPVLELEGIGEDFENPATGNYSLLITVMLLSAVCIGIYTYYNPLKMKELN